MGVDKDDEVLYRRFGQDLADELIRVGAKSWTAAQWETFKIGSDGRTFATMAAVFDLVRKVAEQPMPSAPDPIDVVIDGVTLRSLLIFDELMRKGERANRAPSSAQRAAISANWSAELRAKIAASAKADFERDRRMVDLDDDNLERCKDAQ